MDEKTTPKKTRRVGTLAFALVLILAGVLLMLYQIVPTFNLLQIVKFSPVILIVLGIEMLVYSAKPDVLVKFDWLAMLGTAFTLCVVGAAALLPLAISEWGPARSSAISRIETEKVDALYSALTADPELKAKTGYCGVNVWFNHDAGGSYTLQSGDDCALNVTLTGPYADAESFAADCIGIMQLAADKDLGFTSYHFSSGEESDDDVSYYLDCVAAYPEGLTAAQVARRVTESYHYDGSSFSSEADRDEYIKTRLRDDIAEEYANTHDDVYPDDDYVDAEVERRFNEQFGIATPESAAE